MFMRVGQFLALIAVMASALNSQCALSCSMQALPQTAPSQANILESAATGHVGHGCCPGETTPKPTKNDKSRPCSDPLLTINSVEVATTTTAIEGLHYFNLALAPSPDLFAPLDHSIPRHSSTDSIASRDVQAFFVLRI